MRKYKKSRLRNGFTIITCADSSTEIVEIDIVVKAGARYERKGQEGYAHLLEHMLMKGSHRYPTALDVALFTERAGAYFNAFTSNQRLKLELQTVRHRANDMLEFMCDIVLNPILDNDTLENEKKVVIQEIDKSDDDHWRRLWAEASKRMLKGHPLSNRTLGSKESVKKATEKELKKFHEQFFVPGRMAIVAVGAIDHDAMVAIAKRWFGKMKATSVSEKRKIPRRVAGEDFAKIETQQSYIGVYFMGPRPTEKEEFALYFVEEFLGGGMTSLLHQEVREKRGLVYGIGAGDDIFYDANIFAISTSTTHPAEVVELIVKAVDDFETLFTKELFKEYREQIINTDIRQLSKMGRIRNVLTGQWLYEEKMKDPIEGLKKVRAVTYEDVLEAKKKYLDKKGMFIMQLGKEQAKFHILNKKSVTHV